MIEEVVADLRLAGGKVTVRRLHKELSQRFGVSPSFTRLQRFLPADDRLPGPPPVSSRSPDLIPPLPGEGLSLEAVVQGLEELRRVALQVVDTVRGHQGQLEAQEARLASIETVLRNAFSSSGSRDVAEHAQIAQLKEELRRARASESDLASRVYELQRRLATYEDF